MTDERFEKLLREAAREYNPPPVTPRDEIWTRIGAIRRQRDRARARGLTRWGWWPAAAALALLLGVIAGRVWTSVGPGRQGAPTAVPPGSAPTAVGGTADAASCQALLYAQTVTPYLSRAEALLNLARGTDASAPPMPVSDWAQDLLAETRLLLDSPARQDEELRRLLEDLELVLVQIVRLPDPRAAGNSPWIHDSIKENSILGRLRQRIPAGQSTSPA